jgi:hypothetical protein
VSIHRRKLSILQVFCTTVFSIISCATSRPGKINDRIQVNEYAGIAASQNVIDDDSLAFVNITQDLYCHGSASRPVINENGEPISGASIFPEWATVRALCGISHLFLLPAIPAGTNFIFDEHIGYLSSRYGPITITPDSIVNFDIHLIPLPEKVVSVSEKPEIRLNKYDTSNKWELNSRRIEPMPGETIHNILGVCPGLNY